MAPAPTVRTWSRLAKHSFGPGHGALFSQKSLNLGADLYSSGGRAFAIAAAIALGSAPSAARADDKAEQMRLLKATLDATKARLDATDTASIEAGGDKILVVSHRRDQKYWDRRSQAWETKRRDGAMLFNSSDQLHVI
jgi:hypothetical protein